MIRNINFLEQGKQIGFKEFRTRNGDNIYFSIAIQKLKNIYSLYIFEIEENKMSIACDDYEEYEKLRKFNAIEELLNYFENVVKLDFKKLHPLKGQRIFNPEF